MKLKIDYPDRGGPEGVPRWVTWMLHKLFLIRCRRVGHDFTHWRSCNCCGGYLER